MESDGDKATAVGCPSETVKLSNTMRSAYLIGGNLLPAAVLSAAAAICLKSLL